MVSFNPINNPYMQAGNASFGGITSGGFGQNKTPEFNPNGDVDANIYAKAQEINTKISGIDSGYNVSGQNNPFVSQHSEGTGLVDKLDKIDASILKPNSQDELHGQNIYLMA